MNRKILSEFQERVLHTLFESGIGELGYYLTGGTALSEFYLQHRLSEDLDFFTRKQVPLKPDFEKFRELLSSHDMEIMPGNVDEEAATYSLTTAELQTEPLKIEFRKDVPAMMAPPLVHGSVIVDSFEDISVNKVCAIASRVPSEPKDFVDIFFIIRESGYSLDYLITRAREKEALFDTEEGLLIFATNLLSVDEITFLPKMLKPLTIHTLKEDLIPRAEEIIRRLRPGRR